MNNGVDALKALTAHPESLVSEERARELLPVNLELDALTFDVETQVDYEEAAQRRKALKARLSTIAATFDPLQKMAHGLHKAICDERRRFDGPIETAEKTYKRKMEDFYRREQEKIAAERRRLEEEERRRQAAERRRIEEERLKAAAEAEAVGKKEEAERIIEEPVVVEAAPVAAPAPPPPKVANAQVRMRWAWKFTDKAKVNAAFVTIDEAAISKTVRANGKKAAEIVGGIEVYETPDIASVR